MKELDSLRARNQRLGTSIESCRDEKRQLEEDVLKLVRQNERLHQKIRLLHDRVSPRTFLHGVQGSGEEAAVTMERGDLEADPTEDADRASRKQLVQLENSLHSQSLYCVNEQWISTSSTLNNKRKFPRPRLAKIIVDTIQLFDLANSMIVNATSWQVLLEHDDIPSILSSYLKLKMIKHQGKSKASLIVDCLWDDGFLEGEVQLCMICKVRLHLCQHVFTPSIILKAMNIAGFNLSLAGVEILRCVEVNERYGRGVLPSKASILRAARNLKRATFGHCSFTMIGTTFENDPDQMEEKEDELVDYDMGEGFEFNAFEVTRTLFKAFGLTEEASKRAIDLGLSSDGAQLTNTISHVALGLTFDDVAMRDPFSKCLILLHNENSLVQSRNLCFPLRIAIAKDNKTTLNGFRPPYEQFKEGEVSDCLGCHAFKMSFPGEMKLQWGALDDGAAAKVKDKFCYICQGRSSTLHVPQERTNCQICLAKMERGVIFDQCYHNPFVAALDVRSQLEDELALLTPLLVQSQEDNDVHGIQGVARKMRVCRVGEVHVTGNTLDIDFEDADHRSDDAHARRAQWSRNITHELASRSMETFGSLQERHVRLKAQVVIEQRSRDVAAMLTDCQPKEKRPCTLLFKPWSAFSI